jgi:hypothetical protein
MMHGLRLLLLLVLVDLFPLAKSSYENYTENFSVSLRRKTSPNLLSVMLGRRIWW